MAETPKRLGDYELVRRISDGSQASVYEASSVETGETVAIKVFKETGDDESAEMRFRREADVLQGISHRNIVRYRDSFSVHGDWDEPQNCLVMEFMEGDTLKDHLRKFPKGMPWDAAKQIIEQCLEGLAHAHEKHGITHRDIKPSNIFILEDGQVRLFDFGIARLAGGETMTGGGVCMGSFDYMAPDFALSETFSKPGDPPFRGDHLSDIFSISVLFYELLSGRLPWRKYGDRPELEYLAHWRAHKPKAASHSPIAFRVTRHLTGFVDKGLAIKREDRYHSFSEMLDALRTLKPRIIIHKGCDEYHLLEGCDKGGFGEVYKAQRTSDSRLVAVKRLFSDRASRRFTKEADILRKYNHPHLVEYIDFFQNISAAGHKQLFLVMEYLEGMPGWSLKHRIREAPQGINLPEVLELFRYYLEALQYLHENVNQIIHRDIKPGNLYAPKNTALNAKILDLGIARDVSGTQTHGATPGTWDYMAPEFVTEASRGSPQSDIYALGLSMFEAITGSPAFPRSSKSGQEAAAEFVARATGTKKVVIDCSGNLFKEYPALEKIIRRSTHHSFEKRYPSALHMRMDVMYLLRDLGRVSDAELEEFPDSGSTAMDGETDATAIATQATMIDSQGEAAHQWQKFVAKERTRIKARRRRIVVGLVSVSALVVCAVGWTLSRFNRATPTVEVPTATVSDLNRVPDNSGETPVGSSLAAIDPQTDEKGKALPSNIVPLPKSSQKVLSKRKQKLADELTRDLRLLHMRGLVGTSYRAFFEDAAVRADNAALLLSQREYRSIRNTASVIAEQKSLWQHIADNAIARFRSTKDGRFIATARGALHASSFLYPDLSRVDAFNAALAEWSSTSSVDYESVLPFPTTDILAVARDVRDKALHNKYLDGLLMSDEFSQSLAGMLPHALTIRIHVPLSRGRSRNETMTMVLVPEEADSKRSDIKNPFYMCSVEMQYGAMRCYRDSARGDLAEDSSLSALFSGRMGTRALRGSAAAYEVSSSSEAFEFCNWLSIRNDLAPVYRRQSDKWETDFSADGFRLPTATEWEYAARLGFDWHPAEGTSSWKSLEKKLADDNSSSLVWFYYKKAPRIAIMSEATQYPLGMVDMCGNLGELATERGVPVVCGGSFNSRTPSAVMPWVRKRYKSGDSAGFRIVLPVQSARLTESR